VQVATNNKNPEKEVLRTFTLAAAFVALATFAAAPASAAHGGGVGAWQVLPAAKANGKTTTRPHRKPKRVLRCALFGRYIPECRK
jgi:hypothetical protein